MGIAKPSQRPLVVALVNGAAERSRIRDAVHARHDVAFVARVPELEQLLQRATASIVVLIVEGSDSDERSTCDLIRATRVGNAAMPIVGYCHAGIRYSYDIRALVMAGVHELLFRGIDDAGVALRTVIASAQRASVGEVVGAALKRMVPDTLAQFVERVASHPAESQRVKQVAQALGYNRKTIGSHCTQAMLPPPQELLAWCRLAVVGYLLGSTSLNVETIAQRLDFPSDTALRNLIKRYMGIRATDVRAQGGLRCVLLAMEAHLRRHREGPTALAHASGSHG